MSKDTMALLKLLVVFLTCWLDVSGQNLNDNELRNLYNSRIILAEKYQRRLITFGPAPNFCVMPTPRPRRPFLDLLHRHCWDPRIHEGVVVTTSDQERWLIHKGKGFGNRIETVVVSAEEMTEHWWWVEEVEVSRDLTVSEVLEVAHGNCDYNVLTCNCQHAVSSMWSLITGEPDRCED